MFFLVSGAAASGKTTIARLLGERLDQVVCHDADELPAADSDTRCANLEVWVRSALDVQRRGHDFLLATESPLGELLACPSAPQLAGIAACLLDCADSVRIERYRAQRTDQRWPLTQQTLNWATWHRMHARDPRWESHVIDRNGAPTHRYDRWRGWRHDDPRWQVVLLDTTLLTVEQSIQLLVDWVQVVRMKPILLSPDTRWAEQE